MVVPGVVSRMDAIQENFGWYLGNVFIAKISICLLQKATSVGPILIICRYRGSWEELDTNEGHQWLMNWQLCFQIVMYIIIIKPLELLSALTESSPVNQKRQL